MRSASTRALCMFLSLLCGCRRLSNNDANNAPPATTLRIATFNLGDVRTEQLQGADDSRMIAAAAIIQGLRPDIILLNEIAYDHADPPGRNGQRFADNYLAVSQGEGLEPISYVAFMAPSNTGVGSGFDLDNNGIVAKEPNEADEGRAYGADCWGFGEFPGQYSMALLVREGIDIIHGDVRTFQEFRWSQMPGALRPDDPESGESWYTDQEWNLLRLSSKSHWDIPLKLANSTTLHLLCSHPTPPVFDGPEDRNGCRNHDEIRFWADYLNNEDYIVDDNGLAGGIADDSQFVILGDLNSDPHKGEGIDHPVAKFLLGHDRVQGAFVPQAYRHGRADFPKLEDDDTASWGMRADYVLPSVGLEIVGGGIHRPTAVETLTVSDHFLVWIDVELPGKDK